MDRFRRMEIFVAVVEARQLTRAAKVLHLSKSAVSHALTDLEEYLDLQLLNRNNRSWQLTDAGSTYYTQCKKILSDVQMMEDKARGDNHSLSGHIRLSAPDTFGSYTLAPVIAKFMDMNPNIIIELNLTERFVDLVEERVDIAFRTGQMKDSNRWFEFMPKSHLLSDSGESLREFAIRGQGIAFMPSMLAEFAVRKGRLVKILKSYETANMPVSVLRLGDNRAPTRVIKLLDFIVEELRSRPRDIAEFI